AIALEGDPLSALAHSQMALALRWRGPNDDAEPAARRGCELDPSSIYAAWSLVHSLALGADAARTESEAQTAMLRFGRHPWLMMAFAIAMGRAGRHDVADALSQELEARARTTFVQPFPREIAAFAANRDADGFRLLDLALDEGDPLLPLTIGHW